MSTARCLIVLKAVCPKGRAAFVRDKECGLFNIYLLNCFLFDD